MVATDYAVAFALLQLAIAAAEPAVAQQTGRFLVAPNSDHRDPRRPGIRCPHRARLLNNQIIVVRGDRIADVGTQCRNSGRRARH